MQSAVSLSRIYYAVKIDNSWIIDLKFSAAEKWHFRGKVCRIISSLLPYLMLYDVCYNISTNNGCNPMNFFFTCYLLRLLLVFFILRRIFFSLKRMKKGVMSIQYHISFSQENFQWCRIFFFRRRFSFAAFKSNAAPFLLCYSSIGEILVVFE